jgi:DNA-binding NtrC family response regulator
VLLAEDDGALRFLLASVLRKDGHRVLEVPDGEQLVVRARGASPGTERTHGGAERPVDAGAERPGSGGGDPAPRAWPGRHPHGSVPRAGRRPRAEALGAAFLTKPFELARMRALVRALVARPTARAADLMEAAGG